MESKLLDIIPFKESAIKWLSLEGEEKVSSHTDDILFYRCIETWRLKKIILIEAYLDKIIDLFFKVLFRMVTGTLKVDKPLLPETY